jgi:hypothetical protein
VARIDKKRLRGLFRHAALLSRSCILVNEAFAGSAVEKLHGREIFVTAAAGGMRFLESGAKRRALCAIARHGCS